MIKLSHAPDCPSDAGYGLLAQVRVNRERTVHVLPVLKINRGGILLDSTHIGRRPWLQMGARIVSRLFLEDENAAVNLVGKVVRIVEDRGHVRFTAEHDELEKSTRRALERVFERAGIERAGPPPFPGAP